MVNRSSIFAKVTQHLGLLTASPPDPGNPQGLLPKWLAYHRLQTVDHEFSASPASKTLPAGVTCFSTR
jgi:hypothetical protein